MKAIVVTDEAAGTAGMTLVERPEPDRGLLVGQRVFGMTDSYRGGGLTEYVAIEARNLAPLPGDVDFTVGAGLPMPGLTACRGCSSTAAFRRGIACSCTVRPAQSGRW